MLKTISHYTYQGPSMKPLFHPGDGLIVNVEISYYNLRRGDVINFKPTEKYRNIVHRIVRITEEGLVTRGDNNSQADPWFVTPEMKPELVVAVRRGNKTIKVHAARIGMLTHYLNLSRRYIKRRFYPFAVKFFSSAADNKLLSNIKLFDKKLEIRHYSTEKKNKELLFIGKYLVGHRLPDGSWHIRLLWRLFIDSDSIAKKHLKK